MYCRRENGLRFSHTGTASLTVPRSVSTGFVNHARLTDHSARHKALASCKKKKREGWRGGREVEWDREFDSRSFQLVSNHGWMEKWTGGWNFFVQFILHQF